MTVNVHDLCSISIHISINLPHQVKTQYLQIFSIIDTSIKRAISGQSTPMVKGCIDIMLDMVDTSLFIKEL